MSSVNLMWRLQSSVEFNSLTASDLICGSWLGDTQSVSHAYAVVNVVTNSTKLKHPENEM